VHHDAVPKTGRELEFWTGGVLPPVCRAEGAPQHSGHPVPLRRRAFCVLRVFNQVPNDVSLAHCELAIHANAYPSRPMEKYAQRAQALYGFEFCGDFESPLQGAAAFDLPLTSWQPWPSKGLTNQAPLHEGQSELLCSAQGHLADV
jgi:hypothetical protein